MTMGVHESVRRGFELERRTIYLSNVLDQADRTDARSPPLTSSDQFR
jgi:hypothetical protein